MQWRVLFLVFSLVVSVSSATLFGQTEPRRLLLIESQTSEPYVSARVAMLESLSRLGFSEAKGTLLTKTYSMGNSPDFFHRIEKEEGKRLESWDLVVTNGTIATQAVWSAWKDAPIKIVYIAVTDPAGLGLLDSRGKPTGENVTGVSYPVPVEDRLRFLVMAMPDARSIGYIWGDMPQSASYTKWLEAALGKPEFARLRLVSRKVDFVSGEYGTRRMIVAAESVAAEIDGEVDAFLVPNDQMGVLVEYTKRLNLVATKPLLALTLEQVAPGGGAAFAIFPVSASIGTRGADLIARYFSGEPFRALTPTTASFDTAFSPDAVSRFGLIVPSEAAGASR